MLKRLDYDTFLEMLESPAREAVMKWWEAPGTTGLVYFESENPWNRDASVVAIGPKRRVKRTQDVLGTQLELLPEMRQRPRYYCEKRNGKAN